MVVASNSYGSLVSYPSKNVGGTYYESTGYTNNTETKYTQTISNANTIYGSLTSNVRRHYLYALWYE